MGSDNGYAVKSLALELGTGINEGKNVEAVEMTGREQATGVGTDAPDVKAVPGVELVGEFLAEALIDGATFLNVAGEPGRGLGVFDDGRVLRRGVAKDADDDR